MGLGSFWGVGVGPFFIGLCLARPSCGWGLATPSWSWKLVLLGVGVGTCFPLGEVLRVALGLFCRVGAWPFHIGLRVGPCPPFLWWLLPLPSGCGSSKSIFWVGTPRKKEEILWKRKRENEKNKETKIFLKKKTKKRGNEEKRRKTEAYWKELRF